MPTMLFSPRPGPALWLLWVGLLLAAGVGCQRSPAPTSEAPHSAEGPLTYVGRDTCATCHETELHSWQGSDHDRAMELPTAETVLGDFENSTFTRFGVTTRFFQREEKFFVNTEGPDGTYEDFEIKYTFGIRPMQQYMVELPGGRIQVLRVSWDTENNEWFYVTPMDVTNERIEPGDPLHWTGMGQNWNTMCADCHSTDVHKNYDLDSDTYHTTYAEIDVSCETCHGPGSLHVEIATSPSPFWDGYRGHGLAKLEGPSSQPQIQACAPCHSRRSTIHPAFIPGKEFLDHYEPALIHAGLYHADGQILDEVYVYGSFLQSKMHAQGVRCTDCHDPHSLQLKFSDNRLCTQCHEPKQYDGFSHHHHSDPVATQCVTCHMPARTYMNIDPRRDHSFRVPRPDLSVQLGTPNVCNDCHTQPTETPAWAAGQIRQWYGDQRPSDPHYAVALHAAHRGEAAGLELVRALLQRRTTPDIICATAVDLLDNYGNAVADQLCRQEFSNPSPLVRAAAVRSISAAALERWAAAVVELLKDPVRLVRLAAARRLAAVAAQVTDTESQEILENALQEYRAALLVMSDRGGAHINLATLSQLLGDVPQAQQSLQTAIRLEPYLSGVRGELASLLERSGGDPGKIRELREAEVQLTERDSRLLPGSSVPHYQRGMLLYLLGRPEEAVEALEQACQLAPNAFDNWIALALLCEQTQRWQQAAQALQAMHRLRPEDPAIGALFRRIRQAAAAQKPSASPNP